MTKVNKINIKEQLKAHIIMAFGVMCTAFGWGAFLIPSQVVGGGASGVAAIIYFATGFPVGASNFIINVILILLAMRLVSVSLGLRSIFGVVLFSIFIEVAQMMVPEPLVHDTLLAALVGGILSGVGVGITLTQGGSTGGTDLVAAIITNRWNISPGRVIQIADFVVASSSFFIVGDFEKLIYGYIVLVIVGYVVDVVLTGNKQSYQLFIFSEMYEQVAENIFNKVRRGITLVDAEGWYTRKPTKMIMVVVRKHEVSNVFRAIKEIDPKAFISMGNVMGVYGKGFEQMKVK